MNEIDILAATYDHTCKVYRAQMVDLPNGETTYQDGINGQLVYENLPCALSSPSGGKLSYKQPEYRISTDYLLFTRPDIELMENDYLVINQYGHEVIARAGQTDYYLSHNEVHVTLGKTI